MIWVWGPVTYFLASFSQLPCGLRGRPWSLWPGDTFTDLIRVLPVSLLLRIGSCVAAGRWLTLWILQLRLFFWWNKLEVGGREDKGVIGLHLSYHLFPLDCLCLYCLPQVRNSSAESMHPRGCWDWGFLLVLELLSLAVLSPIWSERRAGMI